MAKNNCNSDGMHNSNIRDSGGKIAFDNPTLCSQLLKDYSNIDILKGVRPEDIEDVSERFVPMFTEERNADVVKKVHLPGGEDLFVLTLIEHKADVDFDVVMQMLRYMVFIWEDFAKQAESKHKGITKTKEFRYPPILPIVYYEGTDQWTAAKAFKDRVFLNDVFGQYIPDMEYLLMDVQRYGKEEIISRNNELSLLMLITRLRNSEEFSRLKLPKEYLESLGSNLMDDVRDVLARIFATLLRKINVSEEQIQDFTGQIKEVRMGQLFEHFEGYDWQATRAEALKEGDERGFNRLLIKSVRRMRSKGRTAEEIADDMAEDVSLIQEVVNLIEHLPHDATDEEIYEALKKASAL